MSGVETSGVWGIYKHFQGEALIKVMPGIITAIFIYMSVRTIKHMAVLPICIIAMLVIFFLALDITGISIEEARDDGWINQADPPPVWYAKFYAIFHVFYFWEDCLTFLYFSHRYKTWCFFQFDKVIWGALPGNAFALISMILVVALSSGLDIAAIDLEVPKPLEYNFELYTIGWSNVISGLTGGYTGSYIFSQTIFSLRAGIRCRSMGCIIAACEFLFIIIPIPLLSYVPNFFFGTLLIMICIDLLIEWLWDVRHKLTIPEYSVSLMTFGSILFIGVESGIIVGTCIYFTLLKLGMDIRYSKPTQSQENGTDQFNASDSQGTFHSGVEYGSINCSYKNDDLRGVFIEDLPNTGFFIEAD